MTPIYCRPGSLSISDIIYDVSAPDVTHLPVSEVIVATTLSAQCISIISLDTELHRLCEHWRPTPVNSVWKEQRNKCRFLLFSIWCATVPRTSCVKQPTLKRKDWPDTVKSLFIGYFNLRCWQYIENVWDWYHVKKSYSPASMHWGHWLEQTNGNSVIPDVGLSRLPCKITIQHVTVLIKSLFVFCLWRTLLTYTIFHIKHGIHRLSVPFVIKWKKTFDFSAFHYLLLA